MSHDPTRAPLKALIAGAEAGHYTLPGALTDAIRGERELRKALAAQAAQAADQGAAEAGLGADLVEAAVKGKLPANLDSKIAAVVDAPRRSAAVQRIGEYAAQDLATRIEGIGNSVAYNVISDHLGPALAEVMAEVMQLAPTFAGGVPPAEALDLLPPDTHVAYRSLAALSDRLKAIVVAHGRCSDMGGGPRRDTDGAWEFFRDPVKVWGGIAAFKGRKQSTRKPWPTDRLELLIWLATNEVDVWMPTPPEQDAAFDAYIEEHGTRNRQAAYGVRVGRG